LRLVVTMALRIICRSIASKCNVTALQLPRAAASLGCQTSSSILHAGCLAATRDTFAFTSLRQLNTSITARSALTDILQEELNYESENYTPTEEVSNGPPEPWQLTETAGDTHMTLTRSHGSEKLQIDLMVNNQPVEPGQVYEDAAGEQDPEIEVDVGVVFNASVTKEDQTLVFECKSDGSYLQIMHVSLEKANEDPEESTYTGPVYEELDERLLQEFPAFLESRGVDASMGNYLLALVNDKEEREYRAWLGNVHKFLTK